MAPLAMEAPVTLVLQAARPSWNLAEVGAVKNKLAKVGVTNVEELMETLSEEPPADLNTRLRQANLRTLHPETLEALRVTLNVQQSPSPRLEEAAPPRKSPAARGRAVRYSSPGHLAAQSLEDDAVGDVAVAPAPDSGTQSTATRRSFSSFSQKVHIMGRSLEHVIQEALPAWNTLKVTAFVSKLEKVGVRTTQQLANALARPGKESLQSRLKKEGSSGLDREAYQALGCLLGVRTVVEEDLFTDVEEENALQTRMPMPKPGSEEELSYVLHRARPSWSHGEVSFVKTKLAKVGVYTRSGLRNALSHEADRELNAQLREAGLKAFSLETLQGLREALQEQVEDELAAASATGGSKQAGVDKASPPRRPGTDLKQKHQEKEAANIPDLDQLLEQLDNEEAEADKLEDASAASRGGRYDLPKFTDIPVKAEDLELPKRLPNLLQRLATVRGKTGSKLRVEYEERGYAVDGSMSREELARRVSDAIIHEELKLSALQEVCRKQGMEPGTDQSREAMLQMLAEATWEAYGVPIHKLDSASARKLLHEFAQMEVASFQQLRDTAVTQGLQLDVRMALVTAEDLKMRLAQVMIWNAMSLELLWDEAESLGLEFSPAEMQLPDALAKQVVLSKLTDFFGSCDLMEVRGIPVDRLGRQDLQPLLKQVNRLHIMGPLRLKAECRKLGIAFGPHTEAPQLLKRVQDALTYEVMPVAQFRKECDMCGLTTSNNRRKCIQQLLQRRELMDEWAARGVPVTRIGNYQKCIELVGRFDELEGLPSDEITERYRQLGNPPEAALSREDCLVCLKQHASWEVFSLEALQEEMDAYKLSVPEVALGGYKERRGALIQALSQASRMKMWDARGLEASRVGDFNKLHDIILQYELLENATDTYVENYYLRWGLPKLPDMSAERVLKAVKRLMLLDHLPLTELRKECRSSSQGFPAEVLANLSEDEERAQRLQLLGEELVSDEYKTLGIPADRLGFERATEMLGDFQVYDSLGVEAMQELCRNLGIPVTSSSQRAEMLPTLRSATVWSSLSTSGLLEECRIRGIPMGGFDLQLPEPELRDQLLTRLMLQVRVGPGATAGNQQRSSPEDDGKESSDEEEDGPESQVAQLPHKPVDLLEVKAAAREGGGKGLAPWAIKEVWKLLEQMRDPIIAERVCNMPSKEVPRDILLPFEASSWSAVECALFVLSSGSFNPGVERRKAPAPGAQKSSGALISVTCPTTDRRHVFHPLLYECFRAQSYEPKELIVVDTGPRPSDFFLTCMQEDPRVVYRHYDVEDAVVDDPPALAPGRVAWTLGLKRNIACFLAKGEVIAHFDDDDVYTSGYLDFMHTQLLGTVRDGTSLATESAAVKLSEWHLLDLSTLSFGYQDVTSNETVPKNEWRDWLYGWGFSYFFTRAAWQHFPLPDLEFAEDAGFYEGLMARGISVVPCRLSDAARTDGLVAHSHHPLSTSGGSAGLKPRTVASPKNFMPLMPHIEEVHHVLHGALQGSQAILGGNRRSSETAEPVQPQLQLPAQLQLPNRHAEPQYQATLREPPQELRPQLPKQKQLSRQEQEQPKKSQAPSSQLAEEKQHKKQQDNQRQLQQQRSLPQEVRREEQARQQQEERQQQQEQQQQQQLQQRQQQEMLVQQQQLLQQQQKLIEQQRLELQRLQEQHEEQARQLQQQFEQQQLLQRQLVGQPGPELEEPYELEPVEGQPLWQPAASQGLEQPPVEPPELDPEDEWALPENQPPALAHRGAGALGPRGHHGLVSAAVPSYLQTAISTKQG